MTQLFTPKEAAEMLCVSDLTLRKWRWEGKGPQFVKIGRKVAYRPVDLDAWVQSQLRISTSDKGGAE